MKYRLDSVKNGVRICGAFNPIDSDLDEVKEHALDLSLIFHQRVEVMENGTTLAVCDNGKFVEECSFKKA